MAAGVKFDVAMKLPQLQNLIKRDPDGYRDDFQLQYRHYQSELKIFQLQPGKESESFGGMVTFLSHVASCYPKDLETFPAELMLLLERNHSILQPKLRMALVQALILMRNRGQVEPVALCQLLFLLFRCEDKRLRELLFSHIVNDVKNINKGSHNEKVNKKLQSMMFTLLNDDHEVVSKKAIDIVVELYHRKIWTDARTVNVIAEACLSKNSKVMVAGVQFFLGIDEKLDKEDEEGANREKDKVEPHMVAHAHSKKTRARNRHVAKIIKKNKKAMAKKEDRVQVMFPALQLINDPQGFAEKLFKKLKSSTERFEVKLLLLNLISRLIGFHKLILLNFYPFIQRYLTSHQQHVTQILAYLVQGCHDLLPPEELQQIVHAIAHNFITERNREEVIALGINSLREIFARVPLLLESENMDYLISDLIMYSKSRDKGIMVAARSILNFIRETYPAILKPKQRGKYHNIGAKPKAFGELEAKEGIEGAELLDEAEKKGMFDDELNDDPWAVASSQEEEEGSDDSDGWVDVPSDDEGEAIGTDVEEEEEEDDENEEEEEDEEEEAMEEDEHLENDGAVKKKEGAKTKAKKVEEINQQEEGNPVRSQRDRIEARRILTPKDFERIKLLKEAAEKEKKDPRNRRKRAREEKKEETAAEGYKLDPTDLEGIKKKKRLTLEERLQSIIAGREKWRGKEKSGGTTNAEKQRKKNFLMVRKGNQAVQGKLKRSAKDIQRQKNKQVKKVLKREKKKRRTV